MSKQNPNDASGPAKNFSTERLRETHNNPDPEITKRFERQFERLDYTHRTRGGRRG